MARKVLISFLGINGYVPVYYSWNSKKATDHPTKFIQEAIAAKLCKGWSDKDCIMVFRTEDSNKANWLDSKERGIGLETVLQGMTDLKCRVNPEEVQGKDSYMIPMGFSEHETEEIFKCVFDKLEKDDEIYFDMTHAFRSIPIFASSLFSYARFLKNVKIKGVYYGAFEALGYTSEVREWLQEKLEANPAPIVDMTNTVILQDLTNAAASFRNGNLSSFSELLADSIEEGLDDSVDDIINALADLDFYIQTSSIDDLKAGKFMKTLETNIEKFCESSFTTDPQRKMIREISSILDDFGFRAGHGYSNVEAAIKWAIDHNMIQQAYTMAKEYLISRVADILDEEGLRESLLKELPKGKNLTEENEVYELRNAISQILKNIFDKHNTYLKERFVINRYSPWGNSYTAKELLKRHQSIGELHEPYVAISNSRNRIAHAGTTDKKNYTFAKYQEEFNKEWSDCLDALADLK